MPSLANGSVSKETGRQVLITRVFDAPRDLVFRAWTDPDHLVRWYSPTGCTISFRKLELHEGGNFHSCIRTPDGHDCWCKGVYREIVEPERIVFSMVISNEKGDSVEPSGVGMDADWPKETIVTVEFAEQEGRTTLTLHQTVSESLAKQTGAYPSWLDMFNRLAETLAVKV